MIHSVYINNAVWLGVRLHLSPPLFKLHGDLEANLERFCNVMISHEHSASHDVVNHDPNTVLTLQEMLPYVVKWTFRKRETGWIINVFKSMTREEVISFLKREAKD